MGIRDREKKMNFLTASSLHFCHEIRMLREEIIIRRMKRTQEKFPRVDEVRFTKFLKIRTQT
jgi:hypothetical protein